MSGVRQIVGAAIVDSLGFPRRLLAARRTKPEALAGLWEFPGGKVEAGEGCEEALLRELREELGVDARLGSELPGPGSGGWPLTESASMRVWFAEITAGEPAPLEDHDELRWVDLGSSAVLELDWIPADLPIVRQLLGATATAGGRPGAGA